MSLIDKHYSKKEAKFYEQNRQNAKWIFEQNTVEQFLSSQKDIEIVADAPLGTNRFGNVIDNLNHIKKFFGFEFSSDMINSAKNKQSKKLQIFKHDLINESLQKKIDCLLMIRMLNLVNEKDLKTILENTLPFVSKYFVCTLRYDKTYQFIENKIHIHDLKFFQKQLEKFSFSLKFIHFEDKRKGNYTIIIGSK